MTSRDSVASLDDQDLVFDSLSERLIYLYLRHHSDKRGVVRLSMAELAAQLRVNRQTIVKHVDSLKSKRFVTREGHGRYRVHAAPWSLRDAVRGYLDSLAPGAEWDIAEAGRIVYGESLDWDSNDPRVAELNDYESKLEKAGHLSYDEFTGTITKTNRVAPTNG